MIVSMLLMLAPTDGLPLCNQEAADRGVQQEMNICAYREFVEADAALNAQWSITRAAMRASDAEREEHGYDDWDERPGYFDTLLEAQRAWLTYRDAHCRSEGYNARGGSLEPLLVSTCKTALTNSRTEELRELAGL